MACRGGWQGADSQSLCVRPQACMQNTQRIRHTLEAETEGVFVEQLPRAKLQSCLSELDAVAADFRKTMQVRGVLCGSP